MIRKVITAHCFLSSHVTFYCVSSPNNEIKRNESFSILHFLLPAFLPRIHLTRCVWKKPKIPHHHWLNVYLISLNHSFWGFAWPLLSSGSGFVLGQRLLVISKTNCIHNRTNGGWPRCCHTQGTRAAPIPCHMSANEQQARAVDGGAFWASKSHVYSLLSAWTHANNGTRLECLGPKLRRRADGARERGPQPH